jgi:membrane-bound metal-dependent hydrolase YbcI (DUF457 family)
VRTLSLTARVRLAMGMSALGGAILVGGPVRLRGQWVDHCQHHFGRTHTVLVASLALGVVAFFVGYDYEQNRLRLGQVIGGVVAVGAVVTYFMLVGRGCGD